MKKHTYQVTCTYVCDDEGNTPNVNPLSFEAILHENIFDIVQTLEKKEVVPNEDAAAFGLGLKLFAEVIRKNQNVELCAALQPHLLEIMKEIKKS